MIQHRANFKHVKRVVVKIGSALLTDVCHGIKHEIVARIATEIHALRNYGIEVVLVTSGSVSLGRVRLNWLNRNMSLHEKQAAAAIGQPILMQAYAQAFAKNNFFIGQMLLTRDDMINHRRYLNSEHTANTLLAEGIIPIVNENDTVMIEEIRFGDNDCLAALTSLLVNADLLIILTDVDGLYDANPHDNPNAQRISQVDCITDEIRDAAGDSGSKFGTGGMVSKLNAAHTATRGGIPMIIAGGYERRMLQRLIGGEDLGTVFWPGEDKHSRRKHWIADVLKPNGSISIDAGAAQALIEHGSSLLAVGIVAVSKSKDFGRGDCVSIYHIDDNKLLAHGIVNYDANEIRKIAGHKSSEIERVLGYHDYDEVIHRDNLSRK
ncbi:MAG: glutamate 5-kinase [Mariprofundales bacterium]